MLLLMAYHIAPAMSLELRLRLHGPCRKASPSTIPLLHAQLFSSFFLLAIRVDR
jgi:hypothetical protein